MGRDRPKNAQYKRRQLWSKNPYCWICGRLMLKGDMTLDHVIPISKGGGNGNNLLLAHAKCNSRRGNADATVIVNWLEVFGPPTSEQLAPHTLLKKEKIGWPENLYQRC